MTSPVESSTGPVFDADALLPVVSVVVVNYNYGRFLEQAVASVFAQTYPRIECIVVDNASTDESPAVIARLRSRFPALEVLERAANDGQTAASIDGLAATRGAYVIFVDADDFLLPRCVEIHMLVHLSARVHVGLTCCDMLQLVDDQIVVSTYEPMASFIRSQPPSSDLAGLLRPTAAALGSLWSRFDETLKDRVHLVPRSQESWVWSPTSGICFRRDALALFCDKPDLARLRSQTDLFLAVGINAICGSILIDEPLFAYRLHGANVFSNRAQLNGLLNFDVAKTVANANLARRLLIEHFIVQARRFIQEPRQAQDLLRAVRRLDLADSAPHDDIPARGSYAARLLADHFTEASGIFGRKEVMNFLKRRGMSALERFKLCLKADRQAP